MMVVVAVTDRVMMVMMIMIWNVCENADDDDDGCGGGGGGFFCACEDFGRMFDHSFPICVLLFFFFKRRLAHAH